MSVHTRRRAVLVATLVVLAAALVLALRACASPEDDVRKAASAFVSDARSGDPAICDLLSTRLIQERTNRSGEPALRQCRANATAAGAQVSSALPKDIKVASVRVEGQRGRARLEAKGRTPVTLELVREAGDWKVDALR